jgi:hypothetical protein
VGQSLFVIIWALRDLLPFWLVWCATYVTFTIGVIRTVVVSNATNQRIMRDLYTQYEWLWLAGNFLLYFAVCAATGVSAGDSAYWVERNGWPVYDYFAAYAAYQVCLSGIPTLAGLHFIRLDAIPALTRRQRQISYLQALVFATVIFIDNAVGRADIQTPLSISFFVFETNTVQLRNACLLNVFIFTAKMFLKSLRRPRETVILSSSFDILLVE